MLWKAYPFMKFYLENVFIKRRILRSRRFFFGSFFGLDGRNFGLSEDRQMLRALSACLPVFFCWCGTAHIHSVAWVDAPTSNFLQFIVRNCAVQCSSPFFPM
jgi:hypothetical protein